MDIWSLGAVFSEAAVWLVTSYQSVKWYRKDRREAPKNIRGIQESDCFHDGEKMLETVHDWHMRLNERLRKEDFITGEVLRMIKCMLHDETSRAKTKTFWTWSQQILSDAKENLEKRKSGNDPVTPTKPRPSESSISSQSTSPMLSQRDVTPESSGQFGQMPRVFSPDSLHNLDDPNQAEIGDQFGRIGLQHYSSNLVTRYSLPTGQKAARSGTGHESANPHFNPQLGPRAQTLDTRPTQHMHNVTQSMSGLNIYKGDGLGQKPLGRAPSGRHDVASMPPSTSGQFGRTLYSPSRREALEPSGGNPWHVPHGFQSYREQELQHEPTLSSSHPREPFDDDIYALGSSRTHPWSQGDMSSQQPNVPPLIYGTYPNGDQDMSAGHWNPTLPSTGRPGVSSPPPSQTLMQHSDDFSQNDLSGTVEGPRQSMYFQSEYFLALSNLPVQDEIGFSKTCFEREKKLLLCLN